METTSLQPTLTITVMQWLKERTARHTRSTSTINNKSYRHYTPFEQLDLYLPFLFHEYIWLTLDNLDHYDIYDRSCLRRYKQNQQLPLQNVLTVLRYQCSCRQAS